MKSPIIPVAVPRELQKRLREAAERSQMSMADVMRQTMNLGLPKFLEQHPGGRITNVDPLPDKVARKLYAEPDDDQDAIRLFMAAQSRTVEE